MNLLSFWLQNHLAELSVRLKPPGRGDEDYTGGTDLLAKWRSPLLCTASRRPTRRLRDGEFLFNIRSYYNPCVLAAHLPADVRHLAGIVGAVSTSPAHCKPPYSSDLRDAGDIGNEKRA